MKNRIYEPARHNEESPAEGMAAVNTHMPEEEPVENLIEEQKERLRESGEEGSREDNKDRSNNK